MTPSPLFADLLRVLVGFALLTAGAEGLVRGAGTLARRLGISALVVGLTVVAFGTSAPEIAVSVGASAGGRPDVAVGNVVGSNIFNVLFILGVSALITPLVVRRQLVRRDVPVMVGVSALPLLMAIDERIGRVEGLVLLLLLAGYVAHVARLALRERGADPAPDVEGIVIDPGASAFDAALRRSWLVDVGLAAGGLVFLVLGANALVAGASSLARSAGVSELVIGLTLVAAGTSLPEVATSVVASLRGQRDLAVGNVVGSNIFNVLAVLGAAAVVSPVGLEIAPGVRTFDFPVMLAVALVCLPVFVTGARISRGEGAVLLIYYLLYLIYLGLHITDHDLQEEFGIVVVGAVLPCTIALAGALWLQAKDDEPAGGGPGGGATPGGEAAGGAAPTDFEG